MLLIYNLNSISLCVCLRMVLMYNDNLIVSASVCDNAAYQESLIVSASVCDNVDNY